MIIIGLGNPGAKYRETRHNAGFVAVDHIAETYDFPEFILSKKHNALLSEGVIGDKSVILSKPQTFMNNSGKAVQSLTKQDKDFIIIHDDIDIALGKIKTTNSSRSAGHNGVKDIIQVLGTKDFKRIRIGIQPEMGKPEDTEVFVLQKFTPKEQRFLKETIATIELSI